MKSNRSVVRFFLSVITMCFVGLVAGQASAQETPPAPTRESCDSAYTACFSENGFFGLFLCPGPYTQCLSQVEGAPDWTSNETVSKVTACRDDATKCRTDAGDDQEKTAACSQTQQKCVSDALGIDSEATDKARACFDTEQQCVQGAEDNAGFSKCLSDLRTCLTPEQSEPKAPN